MKIENTYGLTEAMTVNYSDGKLEITEPNEEPLIISRMNPFDIGFSNDGVISIYFEPIDDDGFEVV